MKEKKLLPNDVQRRVSRNLVYWRRIRNLTQQQLSQMSGVSQGHISYIEAGASAQKLSVKSSNTNIETITLLAFSLDIHICDLIDKDYE